MRVLIAEDDEHTRNGLAEILESEGYETLSATNGAEALDLFASESPDFICLDVMMPETDGYEVCKQIRRQSSTVPIIFISAKSEEIDKVLGLELGADDFIVKPFGVREVVARVRAVTRRCMAAQPDTDQSSPFTLGDLEVSPTELRARRGDQTVELSLREVKILTLFSQHKGEVLDRQAIFRHAWGARFLSTSRTLDQHISQLRKRIELDPKTPQIIQTVHGVGYRCDG